MRDFKNMALVFGAIIMALVTMDACAWLLRMFVVIVTKPL